MNRVNGARPTITSQFSFIIVCTFLIGSLVGCSPSERRQAEELLSHGDCQGAHILYEIVVQDRPRDHRAAIGAALATWCMGDRDRANTLARRGLAVDREASEDRLREMALPMLTSPGLYGFDFSDQLRLASDLSVWSRRFAVERGEEVATALAENLPLDESISKVQEQVAGTAGPIPSGEEWGQYRMFFAADDSLPELLRGKYVDVLQKRARQDAHLTFHQRLFMALIAAESHRDAKDDRFVAALDLVIELLRSEYGHPRAGMESPQILEVGLIGWIQEALARENLKSEYIEWLITFVIDMQDLGIAGAGMSKTAALTEAFIQYRSDFPDAAYFSAAQDVVHPIATSGTVRALKNSNETAFSAYWSLLEKTTDSVDQIKALLEISISQEALLQVLENELARDEFKFVQLENALMIADILELEPSDLSLINSTFFLNLFLHHSAPKRSFLVEICSNLGSDASLEIHLRQIPSSTELPEVLVEVSGIAISNGIDIEEFTPLSDIDMDCYREQRVKFVGKGSRAQFNDFLRDLSNASRVLIPDFLDIEVSHILNEESTFRVQTMIHLPYWLQERYSQL